MPSNESALEDVLAAAKSLEGGGDGGEPEDDGQDALADVLDAANSGAGAESGDDSAGDGQALGEAGSGRGDAERVAGDDTKSSANERARDATGKFVKAEQQKPIVETAKQPRPGTKPAVTPVPKAAEPSQTPAPQPATQPVAVKPPQHWKPLAKEKWAALPQEVQQEVSRVDREVQRVLQENAQLRQQGDGGYRQALAPFENHFRASGVDPVQATTKMLQLGYMLETGSPQQKAQALAHLYRASGADPEAFLAAVEAGPQSQTQQPAPAFDPRMFAQQVKSELRAEMFRENANRELQTFQTQAEFLDVGPAEDGSAPSLRELMAGLISSRVAKGIQQAYDIACQLHPDVKPVLAQREAAKAVTAQQAATQRARAAASSVKTEPTSPIGTKSSKERSAYEEVMLQAQRLAGV